MKKIVNFLMLGFAFITINAQNTIYTNDMDYVIGDVKQAFIQNKITTQDQAQNLLKGLKNLGVNGIRVPIFAEGQEPNKTMFDYFFNLAVAEGYPIFANPAQSSGGHRIAIGILNGDLTSVKDDPVATNILINRIKDFASEYTCTWINPFNEDGKTGSAWSADQMNLIYSSLFGNVNGAELIGSCAWGIPASIDVFENTTISNYITVSATHNLGFDHEDWPEFIALAEEKVLPVWDSEVNHTDKYDTGTRLEVAVASGVDGLVMYNIWNTINLTNGAISNSGKELMSIYLKNMPALTPNYKIAGGVWVEESTVLVTSGSSLMMAPLPNDGSWIWSGPNGFTANTREISIDNIEASDVGNYVASYTSEDGEVNHLVMSVALSCSTPPSIISYYKIDDLSWKSGNTVSIDETSTVKFGPSSSAVTSWIWNGPNNYSATSRETSISDITLNKEGQYQVIGIDATGCGSTAEFDVTVNEIDLPFPDPDARYYIDCPEWDVRLGAADDNTYTTSTSTTGYNVEWTVKESTTAGYYYLDCIGSVGTPRIRTGRTYYPDMTTRASTGNQAKWELSKNADNTYYLSTVLDITSLPRLQINADKEVRMVSSSVVDANVKFTFTDTRKQSTESPTAIIDEAIAISALQFPSLLNRYGVELKPINYSDNIREYQMDVYNIQGKLIYSTNNIEEGWTPTKQQNGVYVYRVKYVGSDNKTISISGKVVCSIY